MFRILTNYNLYVKLFLCVYISIYEGKSTGSIIDVVTISLISIIITMTQYVLDKKYEDKVIILGGVILLSLAFIFNNTVLVLGVYLICEYLIKYKNTFILSSLFVISICVYIYLQNGINEEILLMFMGYLFLCCYLYSKRRIEFLECKWESGRKKECELRIRITENENRHNQIITTLQLQERNEISQRLHDKLGHTLAGAIMQLEAIKIVYGRDKAKGEEMLQGTIGVLRSGMDEIRGTLKEINPPREQLGINNIKLLLEEKIKNTIFTYSLLHSGDMRDITLTQWDIIIEGIREITTNSLKYSKGNKIWVNIEILRTLIKVEVKDNGVGAETFKKGMGLESLESKVIKDGGKLVVHGLGGFSVIMIFPKGDI